MIRTKRSDKVRIIKDINITPFTDVCLVLLIIFMVTATTLTKGASMNVNLPKAVTADKPMSASVTVTIKPGPQFTVNNEKVAYAALAPKLKQLHDTYKTDILVVDADKGIPYQYVIGTIDIGRQIGYVHVGLGTQRSEGGMTGQP